MYVSPNHPDYERLKGRPGRARPSPPGPSGELLAAFPRRGPNGAPQELRVTLEEYQGHPYVSVRLWERDRPTRKGVSVRISEAQGVADALERALDLAESTSAARGKAPRPR